MPPAETEVAAPRRATPQLELQWGTFTGPLDLLVHLVHKHQLSIEDLPVAFVTAEYLRYLDEMRRLDLAIAGEYLVMASTLLYLKSRALLPAREVELDDATEQEEDPREALIRRLLTYQRYRDAALWLGARPLAGASVFTRPSRADRYRAQAGPAELLPLSLYQLMQVYRALGERRERPELIHEVTQEKLSLRQTVLRIVDHLQSHPRTTLMELAYAHFDEPSKEQIVMTFLALLEMAKLRMVRLFQSRLSTQALVVERAVIAPDEVHQRLEGLDEAEGQ